MALTVLVRSGEGSQPPRITFDAPRIVIGRGEGCEVRLPDPSVSQRHASIRQRGAEYIVLDEGSSNGTYVGPMRLSPQAPRVVRSGDLVRVGRVWLEILIEQAPATQNPGLVTREIALSLVADGLAADGHASVPVVRVKDGPLAGAELKLPEFDRAYVVGRMQAADLDIDDTDLSRRHVEILRRGDRVLVRDLGSKNGSRLGERRLPANEEVAWPQSESLFIGASRLVYEDPVAQALFELERAADEKIQDTEEIAPPRGVAAPAAPRALSSERVRRDAPVTARPRRKGSTVEPAGWTLTDVGVIALAIVVLAVSSLALVWITRH